jgi:hypothetical protein
VWTAIIVICNILSSPCDLPACRGSNHRSHGRGAMNRVAERMQPKQMNQVYSDQHNSNIMCTDRPVRDVDDPKSASWRYSNWTK